MAKKKHFNDPLREIDPVMENAFSINEINDELDPIPDHIDEEQDYEDYDEPDQKELVSGPSVSQIKFPELNSPVRGKRVETDIFSNIPVKLTVELGKAQISLKEVYEFTEGSIIELEKLIGEPLDLVINGQVIAQGEVVAIDNNYGLRLSNIFAKMS